MVVPEIFSVVEIPGGGVTHQLPVILRFLDNTAGPEPRVGAG